MKQWIQLYKAMKSKKGLILLALVFFLFFSVGAWKLGFFKRYIGLVAFLTICPASYWYLQKNQPHYLLWVKNCVIHALDGLKQLPAINGWKRFFQKAHASNLPWFLAIGPTCSGTTSLLQASGLHFSVIGDEKTTQSSDCTWWFANDGVILDAAGEFMDNPEAQDKWKGFITKIKKLKPTSTFNAVLVTLPCQLVMDTAQSKKAMENIRRRLDDLYQRLGYIIPVYLMVTQCDRLQGFSEFFSHLDPTARQQSVGVEFNLTEGNKPPLHQSVYGLYEELSNRLISGIHLKPTVASKSDCLFFVQKFHSLIEQLKAPLDVLCHESIYEDKISLIGVYFSSAGIKPHEKDHFFIHDFLKERLFHATHPIYPNKRQKQRLLWGARAKGLLFIGSFVLAFLLLTHAYVKNTTLLSEGRKIAESGLSAANQNRSALSLNLLESIAQHVHLLKHLKETHPWYQRLGMARAESQLGVFETILASNLNQAIHHPLKRRLTSQLKKHHEDWMDADEQQRAELRGDYYSTLKFYLLLNFPKLMDVNYAAKRFVFHWQSMQREQHNAQLLSSSALEEISRSYVEYLKDSDHLEPPKLSADQLSIIAAARRDLTTASGVSNAFALIEHEMIARLGFLEQEALFGDAGLDVWQSSKPLPKFYMLSFYPKTINQLFLKTARCNLRHDWVIHAPLSKMDELKLSTACVLSSDEQTLHTIDALNDIYLERFLKAWMDFIASIRMTPFNSYDDAIRQLRKIQHKDGFSFFFSKFHENLLLSHYFASKRIHALPDTIRMRFEKLAQLTNQTLDNDNGGLKVYWSQLNALQQELERIGLENETTLEQFIARLLKGAGQETELYKTSLIVDKLTHQLGERSEQTAVKNMLLLPVQETYKILVNQVANHLQTAWQASVWSAFNDHLSNYFPFNRYGQDANLAEFIAFFRPDDGVFKRFLDRIKSFVQQEGMQYHAKSWLGVASPFSPDFLNSLSKVEQLSKALFPNNRQDLYLRYAFYPIPAADIKEILFVSNGQSYPYRNGPQEWITFIWPGQDSMENETFLRVTQAFQDVQTSKEFQDSWGLFHLLASANRVTKNDKGYRLSWQFKANGSTKPIHLLLTAKTQIDPFEALLFKPLKIPRTIMSPPTRLLEAKGGLNF